MELLSKKALSLRRQKQQYRTQSPNQSLSQNQINSTLLLNLKRWKLNTIASLKINFIQVTISPGKVNLEQRLCNCFSQEWLWGATDLSKDGRTFKTYT